jgi:acetolactate synthase-1/2/3 large subunit
MMEGVTKHATRVLDPATVGAELEHAFRVATEGRPGPCWVDIPMDLQAAQVDEEVLRAGQRRVAERPAPPIPGAADVATSAEAVAELLRGAERPLLLLGHGIRLAGAIDRIEPLLAATGAPALVSWAGVDMVDSGHPQVFGRAGTYGQRAANFVLQNCDALVCIGTRMAIPQVGYDLSEFARAARIAVVDIDADEAGKHAPRVELPIVADAGAFLDALLERLDAAPVAAPAAWLETCEGLRERYPWVGPEHDDAPGFLNSYPVLARWSEMLKDDQVVVTDMGTALLSGHQVMRFRPGQRMMTSTGLGEMGFGLPGALGASFARDRGEVLCLNCDGGMMMNLQELQTIVHHRLPIKIVVFNNDGYLMIKHTQKSLFRGHYSGTDRASGVSCPDFGALAAAFGMPAFAIRTWEDFDEVVPQVQAHDGPLIVEVFMHPEQLFVPKLSLAVQDDGSLVSPPLEDLSPFLPRDELERAMPVGVHEKSRLVKV